MLASESADAPIPRALLGFLMSERQPSPYDSIARKWLALAERRKAHVVELRDSGRWKHYYTEQQLVDAMNDATRLRDQWATIAGLNVDDGSA
jgi:hypothetical protein